jgi:hypothetical protein
MHGEFLPVYVCASKNLYVPPTIYLKFCICSKFTFTIQCIFLSEKKLKIINIQINKDACNITAMLD